MKKALLFISIFYVANILHAQIQTGIFKTTSGNTDYHHFTRDGGGAAVYINQLSTNPSQSILRLSSGSLTANQEVKFTVESSGNVGIGTVSPNAKLHVNRDDALGDPGKYTAIITNKTNTTSNISSYNKSLYSDMRSYSIPAGITDNGYKIAVDASSYASSENFSGTLNKNIGIWARAGVHVTGDGARVKYAIGVDAEVLDKGTNATIENIYGVRIITNNYKEALVNNRYDLYASSENAKNYFAGNVGIGTLNPGTWKLAVNGNVRAKEIKVETGWSDFVFFDNYNLPSLQDVENHINTYGHLKDIPSAKEVETNGIKLGEMNSKLLQKIEELTLYTIQQEKEIVQLKTQQKKLDKQSKEIERLKDLVNQLIESK